MESAQCHAWNTPGTQEMSPPFLQSTPRAPGPGEAGSYSSHLQLWILVAEEPGVSPDQGWGLSRGMVLAFTGPVPYTLPAVPLGELSPQGGGGLLLPSPNLPLASACC